MEKKPVKESRVIVSQVMMPSDANPAGNVHGGTIMKLVDTAAAVVAVRHSRCNSVTASVDRIDFHHPAYIGDLLTIKASMNMTGSTSMEIGARVEAENLMTGKWRHIASAYLTFVAIDENQKPTPVPGVLPESDEEIRRNKAACRRRELRLAEKKSEKNGESE